MKVIEIMMTEGEKARVEARPSEIENTAEAFDQRIGEGILLEFPFRETDLALAVREDSVKEGFQPLLITETGELFAGPMLVVRFNTDAEAGADLLIDVTEEDLAFIREYVAKHNVLDGGFEVKKRCPMCGKKHALFVEASGLARYVRGEHVQVAFPDRNPSEREFLISGYCESCQTRIFGSKYQTKIHCVEVEG